MDQKIYYKITETMALQNQSDILYSLQYEHKKLTDVNVVHLTMLSISDYEASSERMINK